MASIAHTFSFHFFLFILLSLSLHLHARESKFFTKFTRFLSNAPPTVLSPAPARVIEPVIAPGQAPAPAPTEEENGYGLYGHGSSEFSPEEFYTTHGTQEKKGSLGANEYESETDIPFEKLLSGDSNSNNGYAGDNGNGYSSLVNENNGYNNKGNGYGGYNENENGYMSSENKMINGYNQNTFSYGGNGYSNSMKENNAYKPYSYNNDDNKYSSSMNRYNGYRNNDMSFENEKNGYNGNGYTSSEEENNGYNNDNGYVMGQQGLSDTRFLENDKYSYDANINGNERETSYEEEVSDNGEGYFRNNEDSRNEFNSMKLDP